VKTCLVLLFTTPVCPVLRVASELEFGRWVFTLSWRVRRSAPSHELNEDVLMSLGHFYLPLGLWAAPKVGLKDLWKHKKMPKVSQAAIDFVGFGQSFSDAFGLGDNVRLRMVDDTIDSLLFFTRGSSNGSAPFPFADFGSRIIASAKCDGAVVHARESLKGLHKLPDRLNVMVPMGVLMVPEGDKEDVYAAYRGALQALNVPGAVKASDPAWAPSDGKIFKGYLNDALLAAMSKAFGVAYKKECAMLPLVSSETAGGQSMAPSALGMYSAPQPAVAV